MRKVYQKIYDRDRGDCFRACVASVFEMEIDDVPNFTDQEDWWREVQEWLRHMGLTAYNFPITNGDASWHIGYGIGSVQSPSYEDRGHAVVVKNGKIIHCPSVKYETDSHGPLKELTIFAISNPARAKMNNLPNDTLLFND